MRDPNTDADRPSPAGNPRESAWPLVLGVSVAFVVVAGALVGREGCGGGVPAEQGGEAFEGTISALCRYPDGHATVLSQTHECATSAVLEIQLQSDDPRVQFGGWMVLGNGDVSAGDWTISRRAAMTIPLAKAQPGPTAFVALFSDRTLEIRNLYDYMQLAGEGPDAAFGHLDRLDKKINTWRRGGLVIGLKSLTFRIRRG